jgi:hypothetical protein
MGLEEERGGGWTGKQRVIMYSRSAGIPFAIATNTINTGATCVSLKIEPTAWSAWAH